MADSHPPYEVHTNLDPLELSELAAETFMVWLQFAMGQESLDGKKLKHANGRYAASIRWRRTGVAKVAIIADENVAPEAGAIEYGRPAIDMKEHQLYGGKARLSKDGYLYRVLLLRPDQWQPLLPKFNQNMVIDTMGSGRVRPGLARMWAKPRPWVHTGRSYGDGNAARFRTMSNKPKRAANHPGPAWTMPEFHPYAPGKILRDIIESEFGA